MPPAPSLTNTPKELVNMLLSAKSPADIKQVLDAARSGGLDKERFLGDRESNAGTVQIASNPYSPIIERVTNANDSMLEFRAELDGSERMPATPREAASRWFGVPMTGINDLTESERRNLASNVRVVLEDSGQKALPTIFITDRGIGQHPSDFPNTILSLNQSNKLHKRWLQGAYGQGGSATFRFCDYTILIGRRAPELLGPDQEDLVGWTIVWEDPGDPSKVALPMYKYLVGDDNEIPTFEPSLLEEPKWHGMQVAHIAYDLPKYSQAFTQLSNGIWGMLHSHLFDPVLPFIVGGRRDVDVRSTKNVNATRVVVGNAARLNNPKGPSGDLDVTYRNSETFNFTEVVGKEVGRFRVHYWVVQRDASSDSKTDPTASYVGADSAVSMTLYGQRQDAERRSWLKTQVSLPYLQRNLIVQIDVDELSPGAKRELFASTRERGVEGALRDTIYRETADLLRNDGELRRLDHEERERMRAKSASQVRSKVRERLRRFVKTFQREQTRHDSGPNSGTRPTSYVRPPRPLSPPRNTDDSHLSSVPSRLFFERDPISIAQGRRTTVWVDLDAKNGYFRRHEDDLSISFSGLDAKVSDVSRSELLAGKSMWTLQAAFDAPLGEGEMHASLITPNGLISASAEVTVVKAPVRQKGRGNQPAAEDGPNIDWVLRENWEKFGFTERTVGRVDITSDTTDIWVNRDQLQLSRALESRKLTKTEVESREDRYLFAVGCGLYRREYFMRSASDEPNPDYVLAEQERLAESVIIAIDEQLVDLEED